MAWRVGDSVRSGDACAVLRGDEKTWQRDQRDHLQHAADRYRRGDVIYCRLER
ncbi:hypothetical protein D3C77_721600 [compost metagenome]